MRQPSDVRHVIELEGPHGRRELLRFSDGRVARAPAITSC